VAAVLGSGIAAERLSPDDVGLQLLENAFATAGVLLALILALGPLSGAHFNPIVTLNEWARGSLTAVESAWYFGAQIVGGVLGAIAANLMFDLPAINISDKDRSGFALIFSEGIATIGLLLIIYGVVTAGKPHYAAATVAGYIGGAYWFTSSTSFANPAVTISRTLSDTFAGIDPGDAVWFVAAQIVAGAIGIPLMKWLFARPAQTSQS
jgi:arsenate reductase